MAKYIFRADHTLIAYALYATLLAVVAAVTSAIESRWRDPRFCIATPLIIAALSWIVLVSVAAVDPGGFILWVVD